MSSRRTRAISSGREAESDIGVLVNGSDQSYGTAGTRATQLPAPDLVKHEFLKIFGQPERQTVCQCERSTESNLGMAIQFFNGPLIYNKLRDENNRFRKLMKAEKTDSDIIANLHLAAKLQYRLCAMLDVREDIQAFFGLWQFHGQITPKIIQTYSKIKPVLS